MGTEGKGSPALLLPTASLPSPHHSTSIPVLFAHSQACPQAPSPLLSSPYPRWDPLEMTPQPQSFPPGGEPIAQARMRRLPLLLETKLGAAAAGPGDPHPWGPVLSVSVRSFLGSSRNPVLSFGSVCPCFGPCRAPRIIPVLTAACDTSQFSTSCNISLMCD